MNPLQQTTENIALTSWTWLPSENTGVAAYPIGTPARKSPKLDVLHPLRQWLDCIEIRNAEVAHSICKCIPANCPFERDIKLFGVTLLHIPPLCKLNPLYEQLVALRFRALCYLADECGEDVTLYC